MGTRLLETGQVHALGQLKQATSESEVLPITNSTLPVRDQRVSTQLYCMLVLLLEGSEQRLLEHAGDAEGLLSWRRLVAEYEPATAGRRETSLLLEVLAQTFKRDGRGSLDEFEVKIRRFERTCGEVLSGLAVVQRGIEDDNLRRHLLMHANVSFCARREIRSIVMARETLAGPVLMDVSAAYKGKSKGRGQGQKQWQTSRKRRRTKRIPRRTLTHRGSVTIATAKAAAS